jgi:large subunit ribosomal protein L24
MADSRRVKVNTAAKRRVLKAKAAKNDPTVRRKLLIKGDRVMVIAGGNKDKRPNKGQVGAILKFVKPARGRKPKGAALSGGSLRVVVEGLNLVTKHKRASAPGEQGGKITIPASIHISNVMYYAEKEQRPVRLATRMLDDGRKVRGYISKETKEFVQV